MGVRELPVRFLLEFSGPTGAPAGTLRSLLGHETDVSVQDVVPECPRSKKRCRTAVVARRSRTDVVTPRPLRSGTTCPSGLTDPDDVTRVQRESLLGELGTDPHGVLSVDRSTAFAFDEDEDDVTLATERSRAGATGRGANVTTCTRRRGRNTNVYWTYNWHFCTRSYLASCD